jgi:hypothetical protein
MATMRNIKSGQRHVQLMYGHGSLLRISMFFQIRKSLKLSYILNSVTCRPIAKQRLGKHILAEATRTIARPLLGNGSVNTPP